MLKTKGLRAEIDQLKLMNDDDIDYSDIPSIDPKWAQTVKWEIMQPQKCKGVSIKLDQAVLAISKFNQKFEL